ncbi:FAD-binding oxidoreductase [Glaciihabitans sp. dw_435]|uniref:FAD-binding oxidoreductase n=1 Tax=Glaciihabitans sp. dw_435 TaxID=2720081 RepID=UPI001BD66C67|nr:FAD-binding oxidoreductase [Glaciihabitans sp. dw_435]
MADISSLRSRVSGPVLTPTDEGFTDEVFSWNTSVVNTPDVVVGAAAASDVLEAVFFARDNGLSVAVQSTGHGGVAVTGGLLITTSRLNIVAIDAGTRIATIGAGVRWGQVVAAAAEHGLAPIAGSSATVGVVGYLLGGGLGPLSRSHGFSSDYARGFTVVTPDGRVVEATADTSPDLFWALRGGRFGLGIVTGVRVELVELATLYGGALLFDGDDIEQALRAWVDYTATTDPQVSTSAAITRLPDIPQVPEPLRGHTLLSVRFAYPGDVETGARLAAPLREIAPVYLDVLDEMPAAAIAMIHNDPPDPGPGWTSGRLLTSIDQRFVDVLLAHVGVNKQTPLLGVEVRQQGSATAVDVPEGSAVGGRSGNFTLMVIGVPDPSLFETVVPGAANALFGSLAAWISPENTINFAEHSPDGAAVSWSPEQQARLNEVRDRYTQSLV